MSAEADCGKRSARTNLKGGEYSISFSPPPISLLFSPDLQFMDQRIDPERHAYLGAVEVELWLNE